MSQAIEKVLIVGGDVTWVSRWRKEDGVRIVGLVDLYDEGAAPADIELFANVETAIEQGKPDIVTMVTPPSRKSTLEVVRAAAQQGCDVLLQKLRPNRPDDGESLLEIAESSGRRVVIGEAYRYDKEVRALKRIIDEGRIGSIEEVRWTCRRPQGRSPWMSAYDHVMLEDLTYHHLGALQRLIGLEWQQVYAWSESPTWSEFPHTSAEMLLKLSGTRVSYSASWTSGGRHTSWLGDIVLDGTKGTAVSDADGVRVYLRDGEKQEGELVELPEGDAAMEHPIGEFLAARRAGERSATDIRSFVQATRLLEAALRSAENGMVVTAEEFGHRRPAVT